MKTSIAILCSVLLPAVAAAQAGQDLLASAKTLYESASYEAALRELNAIDSQQDVDAVDTYRALCFLGLGRTPDAERALELIVRRQPTLRLSEEEYSPRIVALFRDVRKRVLPTAAQHLYSSGKADFENKNYTSAAVAFKQTLQVLADVEAADQTAVLGDLKQLSEGFLTLAEGKAAQQLVPAPPSPSVAAAPAATVPASSPPAAGETAVRATSVGNGSTAAAPAVSPLVAAPIYSVLDLGVTPPVISNQRLPAWSFRTGPFERTYRGQVEMIIDETGAVEAVTLMQSIFPPYDSVLLRTAKRWRYQPALKDGKPVKFRKILDVNIDPKVNLNSGRE